MFIDNVVCFTVFNWICFWSTVLTSRIKEQLNFIGIFWQSEAMTSTHNTMIEHIKIKLESSLSFNKNVLLLLKPNHMQKHVLAKFKTQPQYNEPTTGFSNFFENASIHIKNTQTGNFPVTGKSGQKTTKMKNLFLWLPDILMNCLLHFLQDKVWVLGITEQTDATKSLTISKTNKVCRVVVVTEIAYFSKKV